MRQTPVILAVILYLAPASSTYAHHSHPFFYDECKSITLEGRIESVEFKDPHTRIVLRLDDGTAYTVDWAGLSGLKRDGVIEPAKEALVFGARLVVTGNKIRDVAQIREHFPDLKGVLNANTVDPTSIRGAVGNFSWGMPPRTNPPNCDRK
jgi:hypothetical protein